MTVLESNDNMFFACKLCENLASPVMLTTARWISIRSSSFALFPKILTGPIEIHTVHFDIFVPLMSISGPLLSVKLQCLMQIYSLEMRTNQVEGHDHQNYYFDAQMNCHSLILLLISVVVRWHY